jgi:hypothetical protein
MGASWGESQRAPSIVARAVHPNALSSAPMLTITRVVLYKHGIGYFERRGSVTGTSSVDLVFRSSEMNDVLKSLTTIDGGGGIVSSISYESVKPVEKQLEDVSLSLDDDQVVRRLFSQVKGARATVDLAGQKHAGTVLGIETVTRLEGERSVEVPHLALLVGGQTVQTFDLAAVRSVSLDDEALRKDLGHLLDVLVGSKKKDKKRLTIFASGEGTRELAASYILATPVWKTSYRLLLPESADEKPLLQGWALVDNTQDEDWENVSLSLVAGLPISFVHDLYAPRYKRRPVVEVQEEEAYGPPVLESGVMADEAFGGVAPPPPPGFAPMPMAAPAMAPAARARGGAPQGMNQRANLGGSAPVQTRVAEVGDLFHYEIENPVTVKRGQSALVPILLTVVEGRRVALFNAEVRAKNPMSAVFIKNTSGATLEGGPVTVMEDGAYVGEAMLDTMKPDDERFVPYSVELGCVVQIESDAELEAVSYARIVNGALYLTRYRVERTTYVLAYKGKQPLTVYLDHRKRPQWELVESASGGKPTETTESFYRFRLLLGAAPAEPQRFVVTLRGDQTETRSLTNLSKDEVALWLQSRFIDELTMQRLSALVDLQREVAELARRVLQRETQVAEIFQNQERIRQNLGALGASADERGLRERYVAEMSADEDRLRELREEIRRDKTLKESLERDYRERLMTLTFQTAV